MKNIFSFSLLILLLVSAFFLAPQRSGATGKTTALTFTRDVAPIMQKNCMVCHRPGEIAPMSLLSYKEVRPWAKSIREAVTSRRMPPWLADQKYGEFSNDCRLSAKEIETITAWVDGGAKEGEAKDLPPNPTFLEGWSIGKPDVVLTMPEAYSVPAEGVIPYKYFAVPTDFTEDKYVQFAEIRQGNRKIVHHVIADVYYPEPGKTLKPGEINPTEVLGRRQRGNDGDSDGRLAGWAPGEAPLILKPGQAKLIKKGSFLIFQVHYTTYGVAGTDRSSIGLTFSKDPVEKRVITAGAVQANLAIPPGEANYETSSEFTFKEDSHIDSLHPHMHFRGRDFNFKLVSPDGTAKMLLSVPRWDFNWQLTYFLKEPVAAPKGSKLICVAHFDNSTGNKFNPDPTKLVKWGPQTFDEMMIGYFDYTLDKQNLRTQSQSASR